MSFGLTADGFKIKRLDDILTELRQAFRDEFGENIDLSDASPEGQIIAIMADRESKIWELAQDVYNSQYPLTSQGKQLDNVVSITGTTRQGPRFSQVTSGVARGDNGTIVTDGTIISVDGDPSARFVVQGNYTINVVDGATFKAENIILVAETSGPVQANAGSLTVIETPISGLNSFDNLLDADLGSEEESDPDLKSRRDTELQIAGSATIEAIISELSARPLVEAVFVFHNPSAVVDLDGRPPHSLDIVVQGDDEQDLADAIFLVIGGGTETIGDVTRTVVDSQGFDQTIKFSRPTPIGIWVEVDITKNINYPLDGDTQAQDAILAWAEGLSVGQDVVIFGSDSLSCVFNDIPGITRYVIRIGKTASPTTDDNVTIEPRELADFDSSRIAIASA